MPLPATLQINLAPGDVPHAEHTVPHQLRQLGSQVDEILLTVDLLRSPGPRGRRHAELIPGLRELLEVWDGHPAVRISEVDYGAAARAAVADRFFGELPVPDKDCVGAPFYAYLYGLHDARNDLIVHLDSDMLLGGGSQAWLADAAAVMDADDRVVVCGPLPGPPTRDGRVPRRVTRQHAYSQPSSAGPKPYRASSLAYEFPHVSTRCLVLDRERMLSRVGALRRLPPPPRAHRVEEGHDAVAPLEVTITEVMRSHSLIRVDLLGEGPGMWVIHPAYRSELFYSKLPELISRVEVGDVPDGQRGDFELNDTMIDWSSARADIRQAPAWKRAARRVVYGTRLRR
jgi:hypothetical protein